MRVSRGIACGAKSSDGASASEMMPASIAGRARYFGIATYSKLAAAVGCASRSPAAPVSDMRITWRLSAISQAATKWSATGMERGMRKLAVESALRSLKHRTHRCPACTRYAATSKALAKSSQRSSASSKPTDTRKTPSPAQVLYRRRCSSSS